MLVLISPKDNTAVCAVCGKLLFRKDEDAMGRAQRHADEGCKGG